MASRSKKNLPICSAEIMPWYRMSLSSEFSDHVATKICVVAAIAVPPSCDSAHCASPVTLSVVTVELLLRALNAVTVWYHVIQSSSPPVGHPTRLLVQR